MLNMAEMADAITQSPVIIRTRQSSDHPVDARFVLLQPSFHMQQQPLFAIDQLHYHVPIAISQTRFARREAMDGQTCGA
jgi:hypothetical protein